MKTECEVVDGSGNRAIPSAPVISEFKKLLQQSSHYGLGLAGNLALGFISFPIFTRLFSVADYGLIEYSQKILLLLTAVSKAGMQNSALRFYDRESFSKQRESASRYYSTMFFGVALLSIGVAVLFTIAVRRLPASVIDSRLAAILGLTSALIVARALQSILWTFMRIEERTKAFNLAMILMKAITIASICLLLYWLGASVRTYFAGTILAELAMTAVLSALVFRRGLLRFSYFDGALFRSGLVFGLPLLLHEISGIILDSGDRALVQAYIGPTGLGLYSVAYVLSSYVNSLLITPLGLAIVPIYMRLWTTEGREKTTEFLSLGLDLFLMGAMGLLVVIAVTSHDVLLLLASPKYSGAERLIPTIVAGLFIYTTQVFLNAGLMIHKKTGVMGAAVALSAAINLGLNCLLLPRMGLQGAAVATLLSYAFCSLLLARFAFKTLPLNIEARAIMKYFLAGGVAWATASAVNSGVPLLNLACRATIALSSYLGVLYVLDHRFRDWSAFLWRQIRRLETENPVAA